LLGHQGQMELFSHYMLAIKRRRKMTKEEIMVKISDLRKRMARLPIGQSNWEYETLEQECLNLEQALTKQR